MRSEHQSITFYDILGITPGASDEEVKAAYRKLAKKMHPDTGGSARHMHLLNRAYEALKTEAARARYDSAIHQKVEQKIRPVESAPSHEELLQNEREMIAKVKEGARKTALTGILILALGLIVTAVAYSMAGPGGSYIIMTGAIVWGGIAIFRGWYHLLNPFRVLHKAFDTNEQKRSFLLEKGSEGAKAFSIITVTCLLVVFGLASISQASSSTGNPVSAPTFTTQVAAQNQTSATSPSLAPSTSTPNTNTYTTPSTIGFQSLNDTVQQHCRSDQTGIYPDCISPAPHLHCSGLTTGNFTSYSCNGQTGDLSCTGSIIGGIASNTCDNIKGAPYTCQNNSIGSIVSIDCTGTSYIDNSTY